MPALTKKEATEKRRIDRKVLSGKATRKEILRGLELKHKRDSNNPLNGPVGSWAGFLTQLPYPPYQPGNGLLG